MSSRLKSDSDIFKTVIVCALLLAAFICRDLSAAAASGAERQYGGVVQIRTGSRTLNTDTVDNMLDKRDAEKEGVKYTAWTGCDNVSVENYSLGLRTNFDRALCYYGDNHGIFNLILDNGCALSEKAAFEVFGTTEGLLGEIVKIDGESYIVEKLLSGDAAPVIFKAKEGAKVSFDVIDAMPGADENFSVSEMRMNYHISGDITINYTDVIKFFSMSLYIPDSFIPTRWSEFEFWSDTFANYRDAVKYYFAMEAYGPDTIFLGYMLKTVVFALLCFAAVISAVVIVFKMIRGRGVKIGVDNFKKHYKEVWKFRNSGSE